MLPTDLFPCVVDELTAYDSVEEMRDPCKLSSLPRMFGSVAHKAKVGRMRISNKKLLNIVKAKGHTQVEMGELLKADYAQHSLLTIWTRRFAGKLSDLAHNLFEYARLKSSVCK